MPNLPTTKFHLILGDGVVGKEVYAELGRRGVRAVLGSRQVTPDDTHVQVDALNIENNARF